MKANVGDRVRLVRCSDEYTRLDTLIDALGTVHVKWDNGSMGMVPEAGDRFEVIR